MTDEDHMIERLHKELSNRNQRINELGEELVMVRADNNTLRDLSQRIALENRKLRKENLERHSEIERLEDLLEQKDEELTQKDGEIKELLEHQITSEIISNVANLVGERDRAMEEIADLKKELKRRWERIERLNKLLGLHRRFHSKSGCPGGDRCYVCREDDECVGG